MTRLSVNLNKIAVLRNSRGGHHPDVTSAAHAVINAGCGGITVHPRPDQRHIRPHDVFDLKLMLGQFRYIEFNLEGNPFAGTNNEGFPGFVELVELAMPTQCTLVPDTDSQITSDHGFDLSGENTRLREIILRLKALGIRVSLFMDADAKDLERAADLGADRIEIYTGPYAHAYANGAYIHALEQCVRAAERAQSVGLGVNAGHDLNQQNLAEFLHAVPNVLEVSIGHALIGEALYEGMHTTVKNYLEIIESAL